MLYEARLAVARGKPGLALPIYREAAARSETGSERAEVWCELAWAAARTKATTDRAEAQRRCKAEREADL